MVRGFYTAASGIYSQEKRLNSVANNISNARTVGYKRDDVVLGTFGEHMAIRKNAYQNAEHHQIGPSVYMQVVDEKYTNHSQGGFEATSRAMDMSIAGEGFFVIADEEGEEYLTRDGQFSLDEEGFLILSGFGRVQGENGDIELTTSDFSVDRNGNIFVMDDEGEFEQVDRLIIAVPDDAATLEKVRDSLYTAESYTEVDYEGGREEEDPALPVIRQFNLERSNVDLTNEMTNMIASQRSLQSCSQIVKMYDEMADTINNRISRNT